MPQSRVESKCPGCGAFRVMSLTWWPAERSAGLLWAAGAAGSRLDCDHCGTLAQADVDFDASGRLAVAWMRQELRRRWAAQEQAEAVAQEEEEEEEEEAGPWPPAPGPRSHWPRCSPWPRPDFGLLWYGWTERNRRTLSKAKLADLKRRLDAARLAQVKREAARLRGGPLLADRLIAQAEAAKPTWTFSTGLTSWRQKT